MSSTIWHDRSSGTPRVVRAPPLTAPLRKPATADHATRTPAVLSSVSPVQINEILYSIFSFLDQKTLKTVVYFVCRRWRFVATRYIIHSIRIHHGNKSLLGTLQTRLLNINALEVGQKIRRRPGPLSPEDAVQSNEMLDQLVLALEKIQSNTERENRRSITREGQHALNLEDDPNCLRIKILTLNLQVPNRLNQLLSLIVPSNLRELTIDFEFGQNPVHLGTVLDLCSNLLCLTLSSHKVVPREGRDFLKNETWLHPDSGYEGPHLHPLQSLRIINMCVSPGNLQSYFARLGNLIELHCLGLRDPRGYSGPDSFWEDEAPQEFWEVLARDCPLLESVHFPINNYSGFAVPVELFPQVHDYCTDYGYHTVVPMLRNILANGAENRLTTLEFAVNRLSRFQRYRPHYLGEDTETGNLLHQILCSAPLLVHLDTGFHPIQSSVLWGEGNQTGAWACRGLKKMVLALEKDMGDYRGSKAEARHVFAYISRFCPELEELEIEADCPGLSLKSGLCLLTRLRNLQSLTVRGNFLINDPPDVHELAWIRSPSSPAIFRASTSKWVSLFLQGSSAKEAPSLLEEAYLHCIEKAQSLGEESDTAGRLRMLQQQRDNQFCSEYTDQAFPMVDGLVDMEFSGSYLDIEACLQAQLFRLRRLQNLQALSSSGPQDDDLIKELGEAAKAAEVWPHMKKMCLVHDCPIPKPRNKFHPVPPRKPFHLKEKGSRLLRDLRPDITVLQKEQMFGLNNW